MTVYLDTSSLVKLYLADEEGGTDVRHALAMADAAATSSVAYTEARAAFARRRRERKLSRELFRVIRSEFDADWPRYFTVEATAKLFRDAGELAEQYRLRALDAVHLASFLELARASDKADVEFSSSDSRLNRAAAAVLRSLKRGRGDDGAGDRT